MINIGYFADGPWSHNAFDKICMRTDVRFSFICARFDKADVNLKKRANDHQIPFLTHPNINSTEFLSIIDGFDADLFVSMSFNQIFRTGLLAKPRLGTINCHAGKLPFYRGRNILNWALINDESDFGVTVHFMDGSVDTGDIIRQESFAITDGDDYSSLLERAYVECADLLDLAIGDITSQSVTRTPQSAIHSVGMYCSARRAGDERLIWDQSSREIFNFVRAISIPGPSARTFKGDNEILINKVELIPDAPIYKGISGAVLSVQDGCFLVKTQDSFVRVVEWDAEVKIRVGDRLT